MSYSSTYAPLVAELVRVRGLAGTTSSGQQVPALTPSDMMATLALYTRGVVAAVTSVADRICQSPYATADGAFNVRARGIGAILDANRTIDAKSYVAGAAFGDVAYKRTVDTSGITWEPVRDPSYIRSSQLEQIAFLRETMHDYQTCLDTIASAILPYGTTGKPSLDVVSSFMKQLITLGSALDVHSENPPTTWKQDLSGALKASALESKDAIEGGVELAGKAAAWTAEEAGKLAGNFAGGFFDQAGLVALLAAGFIVYKIIP